MALGGFKVSPPNTNCRGWSCEKKYAAAPFPPSCAAHLSDIGLCVWLLRAGGSSLWWRSRGIRLFPLWQPKCPSARSHLSPLGADWSSLSRILGHGCAGHRCAFTVRPRGPHNRGAGSLRRHSSPVSTWFQQMGHRCHLCRCTECR